MKMSKALLGVLAGLAILASAPANATRIVVITHGQASDAFWSVVKKGVDDAGALMGVEVQYQAPSTCGVVVTVRAFSAANLSGTLSSKETTAIMPTPYVAPFIIEAPETVLKYGIVWLFGVRVVIFSRLTTDVPSPSFAVAVSR